MSYTVNDAEFDSVLALRDAERYKHFVKRVADREILWSLANEDGWVLTAGTDGNEAAPFWPHERYAAACATGNWADCSPRSMLLIDFMEGWIPGMAKDSRDIAVFPTPSGRGVVVEPAALKEDIEAQLAQYE